MCFESRDFVLCNDERISFLALYSSSQSSLTLLPRLLHHPLGVKRKTLALLHPSTFVNPMIVLLLQSHILYFQSIIHKAYSKKNLTNVGYLHGFNDVVVVVVLVVLVVVVVLTVVVLVVVVLLVLVVLVVVAVLTVVVLVVVAVLTVVVLVVVAVLTVVVPVVVVSLVLVVPAVVVSLV
jgi:hypothetical protein